MRVLLRGLRGFGKFLGFLLLGILALVLLVAFAIQLPPVRSFIRDQALSAARGSVRGEIELEDVRWPTPEHLELSGLTLRDREGTRVASLSLLMLDVHLPSLLSGQIQLHKVEVSSLYVDLADLSDERGLLSLFASDEPKPEKKNPNAAISPIPVAIDALCLDHGELHVSPSAAQAIELAQLQGCVRMRVGQRLYVAVDGLEGRARLNDEPVAELRLPGDLPGLDVPSEAELMVASVEAKLALQSGALSFDSWVRARGFSPSTLRALGVDTDVLKAPLDVDVHARQLDEQLSYRAVLHSAAGQLQAKGALGADRVLSARLDTRALVLSDISSLQLPKLGFLMEAQVALADPAQTELRATLVRGYFDDWALPEVKLQARSEQGGSNILERLEVRYDAATLSGSGRLDPDGALEAQAQLRASELSQVPPLEAAGLGLAGDVRADVRVKRDASDLWHASATLDSGTLRTDAAALRDLNLRGSLSGVLARPAVELEVRAGELATSAEKFSQVSVELDGGPQRYLFRAQANGDQLRADGWLDPGLQAWNGGFDLQAKLPQGTLRAGVPEVRFVPGESVSVSDLAASFASARLEAGGTVDLSGDGSKLRVKASVPDMTELLGALGQEPLPGRVSLTGTLRGELQRPKADVELRYVDGPEFAGKASRLSLDLKADATRGRSELSLRANAGAASVEARIESRWARSLPLSAAFAVARHDAKLQLHDVPLANLLDPRSPLPSRVVDGKLQGELNVQGNLDKIELDARVQSRLRASRDRHSVDMTVEVSYQDAQAKLSVDAGDRRGQLLKLQAASQVSLERQLDSPVPVPDLLSAKSWEISSELSERPLGELPFLASLGLDEDLAPLRVGFHAQIGHAPQAEPEGTLEAQLRWEPLRVLRRAAANCSDRASGRALLSAKWAERKLGVELSGGPHTNETVQVSARARLPFSELLAGGAGGFDGVQLAAKVRDLQLRDLPWLCRRASGSIALDAHARDVLTPKADVALQLKTKALQWQSSPELDFDLEASTAGKALLVSGNMQTGTGLMRIDGRLPVDVHASRAERLLRRRDPVELDLRLQRLPMASLLAFVPGVARVSGTTSGQMRVRGSVEDPDLKGEVELQDVSLTIPRLGQRFSHVHLVARVDGSTLRLSEGRVRDLDGSASIAALIELKSLDVWRAEVNLNARNFPLRKTGLILGRADADANITAQMTRERAQVDVTLNDVAILLSSEDLGDVQSLEPHPDFSFVDARVSQEDDAPASSEESTESGAPTEIHVQSKDGIWVRRDDFAVQMQADITIKLVGGKPLLQGEIELLRGYLSLFGQSFDIRRGRVVLAGGEQVDPQLEITATHDTPGGSRVRVEVTGFARAPELAFFVDDKPATAREALVAITGGGRGGGKGTPEQQIAAAAIGMTTGLLTLGARKEFGDWVPMLAIEQGDNTRVRVGIEADQFIPKFLEGFVRGAYVEGIISTQGSGQSGSARTTSSESSMTSSGTGVLLELMLPSHFVWAGQYGPGQAWSIDLDWRP